MLSNFTIQITLLDITAVKGRHSFENYDPPFSGAQLFLALCDGCLTFLTPFPPMIHKSVVTGSYVFIP